MPKHGRSSFVFQTCAFFRKKHASHSVVFSKSHSFCLVLFFGQKVEKSNFLRLRCKSLWHLTIFTVKRINLPIWAFSLYRLRFVWPTCFHSSRGCRRHYHLFTIRRRLIRFCSCRTACLFSDSFSLAARNHIHQSTSVRTRRHHFRLTPATFSFLFFHQSPELVDTVDTRCGTRWWLWSIVRHLFLLSLPCHSTSR